VPESTPKQNWFSKTLIENLPAAVYICDVDAVIVAFNKRAAQLWGRMPKLGDTDEKFCGSHRLFWPDGRFLPHSETPMAMVLRTGSPATDQEVVIERPGGEKITVLVNISPLFDDRGVQVGAVNCFQDLTVQKASEQERLELREELRQAQKLKAMGQIMGGVAHDFNNLLTPIIGSLDLLTRRAALDAREARLVDGAMQSAERAKVLVQRLLAFARRQPLQARAIDISALVTGMVDLITSSVGPQIRVMVELDADLPPARADSHQVEMAILNLSVNARDAMPEGGTLTVSVTTETISAGHSSKLAPGEYIRLCVNDTGAGMDAATMAQSTEPFFSTKGVGKGTGLGLSMVDGLVSQLGGALVLSSVMGEGTRAEIFLPLSSEAAIYAEPKIPADASAKAIGRVLLVDDELLVRSCTVDMLIDLGYEVVEATSAEEALVLLDRGLHVDGVVTDHLMPGMTGVGLARSLQEKRPGTPVLIVSGFAKAEGMGSDLPLLVKPFRQADLAGSLASLLAPPGNQAPSQSNHGDGALKRPELMGGIAPRSAGAG
jgi:PAS domain S-box-containing protein